MASLRTFAYKANQDRSLLWWQLAGAGGVGKSRLALQFAKTLAKEGWHAGFLSRKQLAAINWGTVSLPPCIFIVVDYVAEESKAENFADMIRSLSERQDFSELKFVRVLALEREPFQLSDNASSDPVELNNWLTPALKGSAKMLALRAHAFKEQKDSEDGRVEPSALELGVLTEKEMADIAKSWRRYRGKSALSADDMRQLLRHLNSGKKKTSDQSDTWRPLFVMIMAEVFDRDRSVFPAATIEKLLDNVLEIEQDTWPSKLGNLTKAQQLGRTFAMISTVCGGLDWNELRSVTESRNSLKKALKIPRCDRSKVDKWAWRYVGRNVSSNIPCERPLDPWTPDLLGEYFVLKTLVAETTSRAAAVINAAVRLDVSGMIDFMLRVQQDFPLHDGLKQLRGALKDPSAPLPMPYAAEFGFAALLEKQLSTSTNAEERNNALLRAAHNGHAACVKILMEAGADLNAEDSETGAFPLLIATINGHAACVQALLDAGADFNAIHGGSGFSLILMATINGHATCVRVFLDAGADPNVVCEDGLTLLHLAVHEGHADCIQALLDAGADPHAVHGETSFSPLHLAVMEGHVACVQALLDAGADPHAVHGETSFSSLHLAVMEGHAACVRVFLDAGADPNVVREDGLVLLHLAVYKGHADCIQALLDAGADPNAGQREAGISPLQLAVMEGHAACVRVFLDSGADPNVVHEDGLVLLQLAKRDGHTEIVNLLQAAMKNRSA